MRLISWNVNGLRACLTKGFPDFFKQIDADIFSLQETKMQPGQAEIDAPEYSDLWNSAQKKGYSGTAVLSKTAPISYSFGLGIEEHDSEGRVITAEFEHFYLVNVYTPNSQKELARLDYRMTWDDAFRQYVLTLDDKKPVIICGDLNVAHREIDLKNPKSNRKSAGFTDEERAKLTDLLADRFVDSFRHINGDVTGAYSWWSYMRNARENNAGWRIDYFLVSEKLKNYIKDAKILPEIMGSDHCPVLLEIEMQNIL